MPTLTAAGKGRVVVVRAGASVLVTDLVITQGSSAKGGGGIRNAGKLTLRDVVVRGNESFFAGGVLNTGRLALEGSTTISGNDGAVGAGGGVLNSGTMTMAGSSVIRDNSGGSGGGVFNQGPRSALTMHDASSIERNHAMSGGGALNEGTLTMFDRSAIDANRADVGGGVGNNGEVVLNDHASIHHNVARDFYDYGTGGGVANEGVLNLNDTSSIHHNIAGGEGGGVYNDANLAVHGTVTMEGASAIRDNRALDGAGMLNLGTIEMADEAAVQGNTAEGQGGGILDIGGTLTGVVCPPGPAMNVRDNAPDDCYIFAQQAPSDFDDGEALDVGGALAHAQRFASEEDHDEATATPAVPAATDTRADSPTAGVDDSVVSTPVGPAAGHFVATDPLGEARWLHTARLLPDGRVLVVGDFAASDPEAEIYVPALPLASGELLRAACSARLGISPHREWTTR